MLTLGQGGSLSLLTILSLRLLSLRLLVILRLRLSGSAISPGGTAPLSAHHGEGKS